MLRLRTFGSVDLEGPDGGDPRSVLSQPKRLALLIYLAAARPGGVHRRDDLLARFWPGLDDSRARDALNQALRFLRQSLGAETFVRRGAEDVGVDPERLWCDAVAFREAAAGGRPAEALELYHGEFLRGFFVEEGGGFEAWAEDERAEYREAAARGARELAEQEASAGAFTQAIAWGRRALELAPDDERALRRLLRWYDRAGDRAGAFRAYEAFAKRFAEEFGSPLSQETKDLVERLRLGRPLDDGQRPELPLEPAPAPKPTAGPLTPPQAGNTLGDRYRIERKLGAGGMAVVYLAQDLKHDREVALKVLRPEIAEGLARERFIREIRIAGRLQHPNIVPMFDSGEADGRLFYVMPHVQGETLRERLKREGRLPVEEVVHLLREIAGALAYAHDQGVVHRDIKPENVLLIDRRAVLTDFGIARAAQAAWAHAEQFDPTLTQPGTSLGTPAYMAPEQAAGKQDVDHRADLYALGVLGYEMLAGRTPFTGSSAQEILAAQLTEVPASIVELRQDAPVGLADLIMRCLRKRPEERPSGAAIVVERLTRGGSVSLAEAARPAVMPEPAVADAVSVKGTPVNRPFGLVAAVALLVSLGLIGKVLSSALNGPKESASGASLDTLSFVVLPFVEDSGAKGHRLDQQLRDAFARWQGITVVDPFRLRDALAKEDTVALTNDRAKAVAAGLGAGRYVRGEVSTVGDSIRVRVVLYGAGRGEAVREGTMRLGTSLKEADTAFTHLTNELLFGAGRPNSLSDAESGTQVYSARQAYVAGLDAVEQWSLPRADSLFFRATQLDDGYLSAFAWLARVRFWRGAPETDWSFAIDRLDRGREQLAVRDRDLASALSAQAARLPARACRLFLNLARADSLDFAAWYDAGTCLTRDKVVVRDRHSASGWAFRSSYTAGLRAYTQAFKLLPSIHRGLRDRSFDRIRVLFRTSSRYPRDGQTEGADSKRFLAYPDLSSDTLSLVPFPIEQFIAGVQGLPKNISSAVQRQRGEFKRLASVWAAAEPNSADAMEAVALSLAMLADPTSLDTLRRALSLAKDADDRLRLVGLEVWIRLDLALPGDLRSLGRVRHLADSILAAFPDGAGAETGLLASLALLTGRVNHAARLARQVGQDRLWGVPAQLRMTAPGLLVYASAGGPADSIGALIDQVRSEISKKLPPEDRQQAYNSWVVRPATLALLTPVPSWFLTLDHEGDYVLEMQQALVRGDSATVRILLSQHERHADRLPEGDYPVDAALPVAEVQLSLKDSSESLVRLDRALSAPWRGSPQIASDPPAVGMLVRASILRARLAARRGDQATAARWAAVVDVLWSNADEFLQPVVKEMQRIRRASPNT